jgi:putative ATP-binding cassette transporter
VKLIDLIRDEAGPDSYGLLVTASLSGVANALILYLVNQTAQDPNGAQLHHFLGICLAIGLYVLCARRTFRRMHEVVESALYKIKVRIVDKVNRAELAKLEQVGTSEIYDRLAENVAAISDSAGFLANLLQSLCILVFGTLYVASVSATGFALLLAINFAGIGLFAGNNIEITGKLLRVAAARVAFLERLTDLLKGAKEIRFSRRRAAELADDLHGSSYVLKARAIDVNLQFDNNVVLAQCVQFLCLLAVVFVVPMYGPTDASTTTALVAGFLFMWGPLGGSVGGMPALMRSNAALANIEALEQRLSAPGDGDTDEAPLPSGPIATIEAREVCFVYPGAGDGKPFRVGPVNLKIHAGEVIFIVGGNGSGKSTFLKVLTGLYPATSGALLVNGVPLRPNQRAGYRELFSTIFGDFHLFSRLYGLLDVEEAEVARLLRQMRIEGKTGFAGGGFTRKELSTGQRKRLAMVVTMLEERPIVVFDEWAADQDPEFRKYFYEEIVPAFKQRGVTVIAVTHDDRYFHHADRVMTMEYGEIRSIA